MKHILLVASLLLTGCPTNDLQQATWGLKYANAQLKCIKQLEEDQPLFKEAQAQWFLVDGGITHYELDLTEGQKKVLLGRILDAFFAKCVLDQRRMDLIEEVPDTPQLQLQIGGKYKRRDGEVVEIIRNRGTQIYPWLCNNGLTYRHDGKFSHTGPSQWDLIEEIPSTKD